NHVSGFKQSILVVFSGRSFKGSPELVASGDVPAAYLRIPPMYHIITSYHVTV
ncbi:unnamed protein product, partial [Porites lobata]